MSFDLAVRAKGSILNCDRSRIFLAVITFLTCLPCYAVTLTPATVTILENSTQQFTASVSSTWTTNCGSISPTGLFKAPLYPKLCTITATATNGSGSATSSVNVVSPIIMTPGSATTPQGQTQQFTASAPVTWVAACGSITPGGLYTASAAVGTYCTVEGIAISGPKYTVYGYDKIGPPSNTAISISPINPTVSEGVTQQFTSNKSANWATNCGSITATGLFKAPLYPKICTITATATSGGQTATTSPSVVSPIVMSPVSVVTPQGQSQQFTASAPVTWVATCGTITSSGLFTATAAVGKYCSIEGIATTSPKYTVYGTDKVGPPAPLTISPLNPNLVTGSARQFTASRGATFAASCGSISNNGLYTAPASPGSCTVIATATDGTGQTASTTATITPAIVINPGDSNLFALGKQQFTANLPAIWSATCGSIDSGTGLYNAPATAGNCTVSATSTSGPSSTANVNIAVSLINYTTFRGSNSGTGVQAQERVLTPANVNANTFGLAWSMQLDAGVWSQPLYMNALNVNGAPHNVVFQTTANDSIYAIDADTGVLLWQRSFLSAGVTAVAGTSIGSSMNPVGIVGTPVIDPDDNAMYVVAMTAENNNTVFIHRLHAIDITTGQERSNSPVTFSAPGFADKSQMQRSGLLLANNHVYVAFGGIADRPPYQGFLFSFTTNTLTLDHVFNAEPNSDATGGGGIWMSANSPVVDQDGNLYVTTGNGISDGLSNFGQSVIKLSPALHVLDYFTPFDNVQQSTIDGDLGSGGVLMVPDQTTGPFLHELIVCGKPTPIYVLNRDQLGAIGTSSDNIIQRLDGQLAQTGSFRDSGFPCFSTPSIWNQNVYFVANHDVMKKFTLDASTGLLSAAPVSQGTITYNWPGAYPAISANGNSNGIVWTYEPGTGTLRATDANNLSNELFVGAVFTKSKWSVPTVVNGHVYIGTQNKIFAFAPK